MLLPLNQSRVTGVPFTHYSLIVRPRIRRGKRHYTATAPWKISPTSAWRAIARLGVRYASAAARMTRWQIITKPFQQSAGNA